MDKIFLSPHFDDVAIACGGLVAQAVAEGQKVMIVTVCGGLPDEDGKARQVVEMRRQEDREACVILGVSLSWADILDAPYRDSEIYSTWAEIHSRRVRQDAVQKISAQIVVLKKVYPEAVLYYPVGASTHVDHRAVAMAARSKAGLWREVWAYEDFSVALSRRPKPKGMWIMPPISHEARETWIKAVLCYRSQLESLFGGAEPAEGWVRSRQGTRIWRT